MFAFLFALPFMAMSPLPPHGFQHPPRAMGFVSSSIRIQIRRIPRTSSARIVRAPPPRAPILWEERKADKCLAIRRISAVTIPDSSSVDLLLNDGRRMRAHLGDNCPALNFYSGIYIRPDSDGMICAKRDWIRARSGGQCSIESFRRLVPAR